MRTIQNGIDVTDLPDNLLRGKVATYSGYWFGQIPYAYHDDGGVFTDETADANSADANDVALLPAVEAVNDAFYFGDNLSAFNAIKINIGTAGVGGTIAWEYYNGAAWAALTCTDNTTGFTAAGTNTVTFTPPGDWAKTVVNGTNAYWVRARVTAANFTAQPLATQIWTGSEPTDIENVTDGDMATYARNAGCKMAGAGTFGFSVFDMERIGLWFVGGKVGLTASAGSAQAFVAGSDDGITYTEASVNSVAYTGTSEGIVSMYGAVVFGRYVKLSFVASVASVVAAKMYEVFAWELGK